MIQMGARSCHKQQDALAVEKRPSRDSRGKRGLAKGSPGSSPASQFDGSNIFLFQCLGK